MADVRFAKSIKKVFEINKQLTKILLDEQSIQTNLLV